MTRQEEAEAMVDGSHPADGLNSVVGKLIRDVLVIGFGGGVALPSAASGDAQVQPEVMLAVMVMLAYRLVRDVVVPHFRKARA